MKKKNKITEMSLIHTVRRMAELGLDEKEITYALNLEKGVFSGLYRKNTVAEALCSGLEIRARKVEDALYRRAVGFEYEEVVNALTGTSANNANGSTGKSQNGKNTCNAGTGEKSTAKTTIKTVIPDVTACIFWLKNRLPDKWKDPKDVTNSKKNLIEAMEIFDEEQQEN